MKSLVYAFAALAIFVSCEKEINPGPSGLTSMGLAPKTINWKFVSESNFSDTGYYSIQPGHYPSIWQFTRTTKMNLTAIVELENEPVRMSGSIYLKQIRNSAGSRIIEGNLYICETRSDQTDNCLEFVYKIDGYSYQYPDISDLKSIQFFNGSLYIEKQSGRFHLPENNGLLIDANIALDPSLNSGSLSLKGAIYY